MGLLYNLLMHLYGLSILAASFFHRKAKRWRQGRENVWRNLEQLKGREGVIWFHCASLGEFEQGRPVIEKIKEKSPGSKILLTFFSPSGYEVRKGYPHADLVAYLPLDTKENARRFVELIRPSMVFFVKYEFWFSYITALAEKSIPLFLISGNFRPNQHFFQWYGRWFRKKLGLFACFFVQNEDSEQLLRLAGIQNVIVAGDTRFDRVHAIAQGSAEIPFLEEFGKDKTVIVAGSTWEADENILISYLNAEKAGLKFIIAPHEPDEQTVVRLISAIHRRSIRLSQLSRSNAESTDVLIADSVGKLMHIYRHGDIAYVGGGFGKGIHNILEPAAHGLPVLFGPNHKRFSEANELITRGGAFEVTDLGSLEQKIRFLLQNEYVLKIASEMSRNYVISGRGASDTILGSLSEKYHLLKARER